MAHLLRMAFLPALACTLGLLHAGEAAPERPLLQGATANARLHQFMAHDWSRLRWLIVPEKQENGRVFWQIHGTMFHARLVGSPPTTTEADPMTTLDPQSAYEIYAIPVSQDYGTITFHLDHAPKKVAIPAELPPNKEQQAVQKMVSEGKDADAAQLEYNRRKLDEIFLQVLEKTPPEAREALKVSQERWLQYFEAEYEFATVNPPPKSSYATRESRAILQLRMRAQQLVRPDTFGPGVLPDMETIMGGGPTL